MSQSEKGKQQPDTWRYCPWAPNPNIGRAPEIGAEKPIEMLKGGQKTCGCGAQTSPPFEPGAPPTTARCRGCKHSMRQLS